jgi:hypothetical protein
VVLTFFENEDYLLVTGCKIEIYNIFIKGVFPFVQLFWGHLAQKFAKSVKRTYNYLLFSS